MRSSDLIITRYTLLKAYKFLQVSRYFRKQLTGNSTTLNGGSRDKIGTRCNSRNREEEIAYERTKKDAQRR